MFNDFNVDEFASALQIVPFVSDYNVVVVKDLDFADFSASDGSRIIDLISNVSGDSIVILTYPTAPAKAAKEMTATGTRKHTEIKRERKPNETKQWIMNRVKILFEGFALTNDVADVTLSNAERTLDFIKDGKNYTLTLTEHRPPKK